jgi:sphingomyelin phosphodiesterase
MNYCYNMNFWLLLNSVDPLDQLAWLIETLQQSENKGEKVK